MRKFSFECEQIYHVYNRGVDKRVVFVDKYDYEKFLKYLIEFNTFNPVFVSNDLAEGFFDQSNNFSLEKEKNCDIDDDPLVDILAFCLMPNHFHLLLRQKKEGGVVKFMQRIGTGYTMVFNSKKKRSGSLFQGRFKAVHVDKQSYLDYLIFYIHFNPLKLMKNEWLVKNDAIDFLDNYKWSSHLEYMQLEREKYFLTNKSFVFDMFRDSTNYRNMVDEWLGIIEEKEKEEESNAYSIDFNE